MLSRFIEFRINVGDLTSQNTFRLPVNPELVLTNDSDLLEDIVWGYFDDLIDSIRDYLIIEIKRKKNSYFLEIYLEDRLAKKVIIEPRIFFGVDRVEEISPNLISLTLDDYWADQEYIYNLIELTDLALVFE